MSEELLQRDLIRNPEKIGKWDFYNIGAITVKAFKEYGIIRSVNYGNEEKKKVDALLVQRKNVIAIIEYKKPSGFKTAEQKKKAIKQELKVARKLNAKIFIATDTKETVWVNVATGNRIKDENNKELKADFDPKSEKLPDLFEKIIVSINEKNDRILGIVKENKAIDISGFSDLINDISEIFKEYSSLLKEVAEKIACEFREISLSNKNYFDLFIGKRLVKTPISFHNHSNIINFSNNSVLWGIDGDFSTTDHCGAIKILQDDILPEYLMLQLEKVKHKYGFDRGLRSSLKNMQNVCVEIPFNEQGNINIEKQKEAIEKYEYIAELRIKIEYYKKQINTCNVKVKKNNKLKSKQFYEIFDFPSIKGLTKQFIENNKGTIPVYGGKIEEEPIGFIADNLPNVKYFNNCLAWNREGSVGYVFWHKHKFTTNDHHRPIFIKKEYKDLLDLAFLQYSIQIVLMNEDFVWSKTASKEKVEKLMLEIPVDSNGDFDLPAQKQIAEKYQKIEQIKKTISKELDRISKIEIEF